MKHIDPFMRAQLIQDYTASYRGEEVVGKAPKSAVKNPAARRPLIKDAVKTWEGIIPTEHFPMGTVNCNQIMVFVLSELGYDYEKIASAVILYKNMSEAKWKGRLLMENDIRLAEAAVLLNQTVNK